MMEKTYQLSHVVAIVQEGFRQLFDSFDFWFHAQISRVTLSKSSLYFDLIETDPTGKIKAKARGVVFDMMVWKNFLQEVGLESWEQLKGSQMLLYGTLQFHPEYGMSIIISQISGVYTLGQLQQRQQGLLQQLQVLGIDQNNKKIELGFPPYTIAVISSATSQGLKDFTTVLDQSDFLYTLKPYYTTIHGNEAIQGVYDQLQKIYKDIKSGVDISLVAILRGGGGSSGIARQDDVNIAKGICYMPVSVMVAVGHTSDAFLLDQICRYAAKTPTDGAYIILEEYQKNLQEVEKITQEINYFIEAKKSQVAQQIYYLREHIQTSCEAKKAFLTKSVQQRREQIQGYAPERLMKAGFAIVSTPEGIISYDRMQHVEEGQQLHIKIYNKVLQVKVEKVESMQGKDIV